MNKFLIASLLLLGSYAYGQTVHAAMQENSNTFSGTNQFAKGAILGPVPFASIGTLPTSPGETAYISDGAFTNPCTGGGQGALATWNGTQWNCASGTITGVVAGTGLTGGGTAGSVSLSVTNPMPTGVATGSLGASNGVGQPMVYQIKHSIDPRDKGVDCTGLTDTSTALNTLLSSINQTEVDFPQTCQMRVDHPVVIQSQAAFVLKGLGHKPGVGGYGGPSIFGCNGTTGPVLYINRSGYGRIEGLGIYPKGNPGVCASSGFTQSIQIDSTGNPGVTTHDIQLDGVALTTSPQGGAISGYVGLSITDGGKQNGEMIQVRNSWIHCQNSTNSIGIDLENGTSDKDKFTTNNIANCYIGIKHGGGNATIEGNLFSSVGNFSVFGANGAAIYIGTCASGGINILNNEVDSSGDFINSGNDGVGAGCNAGLNIEGNFIAVSDPTPNNYVINIGNCCVQGYNLIGNGFLVTSNTSQYLVGTAANGLFGPLGYLYDLNNTLRAPTGTNSLGLSNLNFPFQQGEFHTPLSYSGNALNATFGPNGNIPEFSSYNRVLFANPSKPSAFGQQSPFLAFRSWTGGAYDDWSLEALSSATTSQLSLVHSKGPSTNNWFVFDGKTSGFTLGTVATPVAPGVQVFGTSGATTYTYSVVDFGPNGNTIASSTTSTNTGNATLSTTNFNQVSFGYQLGTTKVCVRREVGGATQGIIGCVPVAAGNQTYSTQLNANIYILNDTGLVGDSSTTPASNTTGLLDVSGGFINMPIVAGFTATATHNMGYDSTASNWHVYQNAADRLMAVINGTITNGDCAKFVIVGSTITVQDNGTTCGGGGGGSPGGASLSSQYNNGGVLAGTTLGTNQGTYIFGRVNTSQGTATSPVELQVSDCASPGSISGAGTTYTVAYTDVVGCNVVHDRAASGIAAVTLPTPSTLNNPAPIFVYSNYSAQNDVITPTTYTISPGTVASAASLTVNSGFSCKIQLDPVNASTWKADCHQMQTTAGSGGTTNALTMNNGNSGAASGSTFNGSAPITISTNTIGAPNLGTANTFGAFLQDFSASTIKAPVAAGFTTTTNGNMGYDSTNLNWHIWQNGADRIEGVINGSTTDGHCVKFVMSGSTVSLQDAGTSCIPSMPFVWLPYVNQGPPAIGLNNETDGTANNLVCRSFNVPNQITATKFTVNVAAISAAQTFNIGIYDSSGNLVRDSGAMSCGTATQVSSTVSAFTLTPGNTYAECVAITDTVCALTGSNAVVSTSSTANKNATRDFACANTLAAGAMPATCGTPSAQSSKSYLVLLEQ